MKKTIRHCFLYGTFTTAMILNTPAHAGLFSDDEARTAILEVRTRLEASLNAQQEQRNQIELLRQEVAKLRGQNETLFNEVSELKRAQTDGYASIDERVRKFEPQTVQVAGIQGVVQPDEQNQYDAALKLFNDGNYPAAQKSMSAFTNRYPKSVYLPFVQFYQGTAAFVNRDYKNAAALLQNVLKQYPEFERTSDALLNLANTFIEVKQIPAAQKTLRMVQDKFPNTDNAKEAQNILIEISK
ncbi:tol-pal system protein YbgF [Hydromonas duriensis]|uniref:Cell division coordinator CpoB n=1 Tax=Hydromonas duriensis TaxID=1527608 RepID=A0A4R6YC38_9BURK|nr:tol-pal system protein YbgF [Hydromonas duriensis]TDR33171.1 tol-pal system protein YbgF [Hydromonas duriensis]